MPSTADLSDQYGNKAQYSQPIFKAYGGKQQIAGRIVTVKCFEDNSLIKSTLSQPGENRILVADAGGSKRCAMLGDMIAKNAVKNNWQGVIIYGLVRDCIILKTLNFGVWALGTIALKSVRLGVGQKNIAINFANINFQPNDYLFADQDGIMLIKQEYYNDN